MVNGTKKARLRVNQAGDEFSYINFIKAVYYSQSDGWAIDFLQPLFHLFITSKPEAPDFFWGEEGIGT